MNRLLSILLSLLTCLGLAAQVADTVPVADLPVLRPVTASYTLEAGSSHLTDTYLSPLKYDGWHTAFAYERYQAMKFSPERWTMSLTASLALDKTDNPARNASMYSLMVRAGWSMMRRWRPFSALPSLTLALGGGVGLEAGALYNDRNGNNPASAKAALTLDLTGFASWRTRVGRLPVTLTYRPTLPLAGAFFSPDYGELYYEIWLGDHGGLAHFAWPGNYFSLDSRLTADLHFSATSLRIGYAGRVFSSKTNDIVTNIFTHALVIGVSGDWLSLDCRKGLPRDARVIHATY